MNQQELVEEQQIASVRLDNAVKRITTATTMEEVKTSGYALKDAVSLEREVNRRMARFEMSDDIKRVSDQLSNASTRVQVSDTNNKLAEELLQQTAKLAEELAKFSAMLVPKKRE